MILNNFILWFNLILKKKYEIIEKGLIIIHYKLYISFYL